MLTLLFSTPLAVAVIDIVNKDTYIHIWHKCDEKRNSKFQYPKLSSVTSHVSLTFPNRAYIAILLTTCRSPRAKDAICLSMSLWRRLCCVNVRASGMPPPAFLHNILLRGFAWAMGKMAQAEISWNHAKYQSCSARWKYAVDWVGNEVAVWTGEEKNWVSSSIFSYMCFIHFFVKGSPPLFTSLEWPYVPSGQVISFSNDTSFWVWYI